MSFSSRSKTESMIGDTLNHLESIIGPRRRLKKSQTNHLALNDPRLSSSVRNAAVDLIRRNPEIEIETYHTCHPFLDPNPVQKFLNLTPSRTSQIINITVASETYTSNDFTDTLFDCPILRDGHCRNSILCQPEGKVKPKK